VSLDYAQEKAYKTLQSLGPNEGSLKERLQYAVIPSFMSLADEARLGASGLLPALVGDIEKLWGDLTRQEAKGDEGTVAASLNELDEAELISLGERMVTVCIGVMQTEGTAGYTWRLDGSVE